MRPVVLPQYASLPPHGGSKVIQLNKAHKRIVLKSARPRLQKAPYSSLLTYV